MGFNHIEDSFLARAIEELAQQAKANGHGGRDFYLGRGIWYRTVEGGKLTISTGGKPDPLFTPVHCYDLIPPEVLEKGIAYANDCWEYLRTMGANPYEGGRKALNWELMDETVRDPLTHIPLKKSDLRKMHELLLGKRAEELTERHILANSVG